jgi:diguanylate cyclase (GGDEF)-like protein
MLAACPSIMVTGVVLPAPVTMQVLVSVTVVSVLTAVGGAVCRLRPEMIPNYFWIGAPFFAVAIVTGMDLVTQDAGVGGQIFFLWPVLYSATFLGKRINYAVMASVFAGEATVVFVLLEPARAIPDLITMMTALTMSGIVVYTLRERRDQLLAVLETQALADPLTGLSNRRSFDRELAHADAWVRRSGGPLALLTVDLDHFKSINDTWGHAVGDIALQTVATAMRTVSRDSDTVARLGGDEFVMLLRCDRIGALRVADAVRAAVAASHDVPGGPPRLSIGLAVLPDDATTVEGLLGASDAALYQAKVAGRDRVASPGDHGGTASAPVPDPASARSATLN